MQDISFDQLLEATRALQPQQRHALAQVLHFASPPPSVDNLLAESGALNEAGAFSVFAPLCDVHLQTVLIADAELIAAAQYISCEWEEEPI